MGAVLIGVFGTAQIGGGVFLVDASLGFPPGAAAGRPAEMS